MSDLFDLPFEEEEPELVDRGAGHPVACHFAAESPVALGTAQTER